MGETKNMVVQDSNPERRNLVVTSIAFIAYFFAGGSFPETSVRLQVINAEFSDPWVLSIIAWTIYIWFIYRYWVTHRGAFAKAFCVDFNKWHTQRYITNYLNQHFDQKVQPNIPTAEYMADGMRWKGWRVIITCNYRLVRRDINGMISATGGQIDEQKPQQDIQLVGLKGWFLAIMATIDCLFRNPSFSGYVVPYILVIVTLAGAMKSVL